MTQQKTLITTDIDYEKQGFQSGVLRLPHSVDRSGYGHIPIPIAVLRNGDGPTLLLTGGNHGDEYEGPVALMKLVRRMQAMNIRGRLIVIPGLNFPAFVNGTRTSPVDKANLNRVFPGKRNGSLTEMIAHYVDTELFPRTDVAFDIHSGGASFTHLPTLLAALPTDPSRRPEYRRLIDAFGAPRAMVANLLGEDRTFGATAMRHEVLFLCGEFGGGSNCAPEGLAIVEDGIDRLLYAMGMTSERTVDAAKEPPRLLAVEGGKHYIFAGDAGVFEPAFRIGDEIRPGQLAGRIHDPYHPGRSPVDVHFEGGGTAICLRTFAAVVPGDCLGHLASDTTWEAQS